MVSTALIAQAKKIQDALRTEAAWDEMDSSANGAMAMAGDGGAYNPSEAFENLVNFVTQIVDGLVLTYDLEEDEAFEMVLAAAEELTKEGTLPAFPEEDADDAEIALWLGAAKSVAFGSVVDKFAQAEMD